MPEEVIRRRVGVGLHQAVGGYTIGGELMDQIGEQRAGNHTVFMDNLPEDVSKRSLYKVFGRYGFISDIYVSRRSRRNPKRTFAFIRFKSYGGALKSISNMNGTMWGGTKLFVTLSKSRREMKVSNGNTGRGNLLKLGPKIIKNG
ncbi:hypothetical protein PIB30_033124 [Stylosanthes scabra]|uniref:RRM domain-containing protein n=1 Tax=Stylosanthes scabra TaxID=79078 RepID=A0ABU6VBR8_9FABA|nr:hypothetical protein [Stylosanthes scabra]